MKNGKIPDWMRTIRRWKIQILCVLGGFFLYALAMSGAMSDRDIAEGRLMRGGYGEGEREYEFQVKGLAETPVLCQVEISPRQYTEEEAQEMFHNILESLEEQILGENESLSKVETNLELPVEFAGTGITAQWQSDAPDILDSYGQIQVEDPPENGVEVWLSVELTDGVHRAESTFPVRITARTVTEEQRLTAGLIDEIELADKENSADISVKLPETYEGKALSYDSQTGDYRLLPLLGILFAILFWARDKNKIQEEKKQRKDLLMLDYADVVYQLMVFVGAGLTVARAWERIVLNYEERRQGKRCGLRPAYEEMADARARMQCGVPESQAIAEFGQKCQLQPYLKLSGILEQNRRTGTKNLTQLLGQEMTVAWEQQKNMARRLGEEAGTKLLLPLMLMLVVIMVIIMVPAMMSMA